MSSQTVRRILFPTDFSACAEGAYRHAAYLADRFGSELHVLHVVEDDDAPERAWPDVPGLGHLRVTMADVCDDLRLSCPTDGRDPEAPIEIVETEVVGRQPADAIVDHALDEEIDLIVIGTHGRRGWQRGVLGSVAEAVCRRSPCPVLTVRPFGDGNGPLNPSWPPRRVLAALDARSVEAGIVPPAVQWAARLAGAYDAPLDLVHVTPPIRLTLDGPGESSRARAEARQSLVPLCEQIRDTAGISVNVVVRSGEPADGVRAVALERRTHLVVVGTHGRRGPGRVLLGSVAESVIRTAPCPVLVVRDALEEPTRSRPASRSGTAAS